MTTPAQLSAQIVDLMTRWNAQQDQLADWLTGDPAGGPNGDGRYPLTNAEGTTELFQSLPSIINSVSGPAAAAQAAQTAAELARSLAQAAQAAAEAAQAAAANSQSAVQGLRTIVDTQQSDVAAKWSDVGFWHGQVGTNTLAVETATTVTLGYRDETLLARDDTLVARDQAQVARDAAQGFAASIDPSLLATKAELAAELDALVSAAPGTLDTLNEIAAALGDDPNFATTVTASLAGKANIGHTHVIGDVTGLQTALDSKQPVGSYAASGHTHVIGDVTGLQGALDGKLSLTGGTINGGLTVVGIVDGTSPGPGSTGGLRVRSNASSGLAYLQVTNTAATEQWGFWQHSSAGDADWYGNGGVKVSGNTVWHGGNFNPADKANAAHVHTIANVTGLQAALDASRALTTTGQAVVASSMTLDASLFGSNVLVVASGITLTLPGSGASSGTTLAIKNATSGFISIAYAFAGDGPTSLGPGQSAVFISDGGSSNFWRSYFLSVPSDLEERVSILEAQMASNPPP